MTGTAQPGFADLLGDWITIWQSECAARALDRDTQEVCAAALRAVVRAAKDMHDAATATGPDAPPWPTPTLAASGPGSASLAELERRVAELERRLAMGDGTA